MVIYGKQGLAKSLYFKQCTGEYRNAESRRLRGYGQGVLWEDLLDPRELEKFFRRGGLSEVWDWNDQDVFRRGDLEDLFSDPETGWQYGPLSRRTLFGQDD